MEIFVILTYINESPIKRSFVEDLPYNPNLKQRARSLRKAGVFSEVIFWKHVNRKQFHSIDFDRQRVIGNYIVDFYVKALGLVVEIDGSSHNDKEDYDLRRDDYLKSLGLIIFRVSDLRIKHDLENVLKELEGFIVENFGTNK